MTDLEATFRSAVALHKAGDLAKAERIYTGTPRYEIR